LEIYPSAIIANAMKKSFLLSILIPFCLFQSVAFASPDFKPKINPKITTDVIEGQLKGRPTFKIGDWNSSGAPEIPYVPNYEFAYQCQAQLDDGLTYGEGASAYRFYAVADFKITNENTFYRTDDLTWFAKKRRSSAQILDSDDLIPFSTRGSWIRFGLRPGSASDGDRTYLYLELDQAFGPAIVVESALEQGTRFSGSLTAEAHVETKSNGKKAVPSMTLKVYCDKEK
jgi:hypothetical protein